MSPWPAASIDCHRLAMGSIAPSVASCLSGVVSFAKCGGVPKDTCTQRHNLVELLRFDEINQNCFGSYISSYTPPTCMHIGHHVFDRSEVQRTSHEQMD